MFENQIGEEGNNKIKVKTSVWMKESPIWNGVVILVTNRQYAIHLLYIS